MMTRTGTLAALLGVSGVSIQAMAVDMARPMPARRQLAVCMVKQMTASRSMSYNQATAVCKAQMGPKGAALASTIKPANGIVK